MTLRVKHLSEDSLGDPSNARQLPDQGEKQGVMKVEGGEGEVGTRLLSGVSERKVRWPPLRRTIVWRPACDVIATFIHGRSAASFVGAPGLAVGHPASLVGAPGLIRGSTRPHSWEHPARTRDSFVNPGTLWRAPATLLDPASL